MVEHRSTPLAFARRFAGRGGECDLESVTSVVHDPRNEVNTRLTIDHLGNVVGGRRATYVNVDMATLKTACVKMLQAGRPVFFGCDFGKFRHRDRGVMDLAVYDYAAGLGTTLLEQSKADRLRAGESLMTHAMVLTGVHVDDDGRPVRWRVQNSHGDGARRQGVPGHDGGVGRRVSVLGRGGCRVSERRREEGVGERAGGAAAVGSVGLVGVRWWCSWPGQVC